MKNKATFRFKRVGVALAAAGLLVGFAPASAMAAEVPALPDEIVKAIQEHVPAELARYALPQHAQGEPDDGRLYYPYGATVGQAVTVMTWGG